MEERKYWSLENGNRERNKEERKGLTGLGVAQDAEDGDGGRRR